MCTLASASCYIYVYTESSLTCYLGNFILASNGNISEQGGTEIVNTRISSIGKWALTLIWHTSSY
jgi:hypothetical protein